MQPANPEDRYKPVRGLSRGLAVLRAVNLIDKVDVTVKDVSDLVKLHRTTVQRLLETLVREGYLRRGESKGSYRVDLKVRDLSNGFTEAGWISSVAAKVMGEMLERVVWPSSLSTLSGTSMLIRETTHRISPLSFHQEMVGRRIPILTTASGRASFAFLPLKQRMAILRELRRANDIQASLARDSRAVEALVRQVRADTYAFNSIDRDPERKTGAIAMAVQHKGRVLASLNIIYLRTAVSEQQARERFVPELRQAVMRISHLMQLEKYGGDV